MHNSYDPRIKGSLNRKTVSTEALLVKVQFHDEKICRQYTEADSLDTRMAIDRGQPGGEG